MSGTILEAAGVEKSFNHKPVIKDINFKILKGDIFAILGKNGVGKTVLVSVLTGLLKADKGRVLFKGDNIEADLSGYHQQINLASSYQSLQVHATAGENLITFARLYGVEEAGSRIKQVMKLVGLEQEGIINKKVFKMSSGEIARINLAKALISRPEILFLDEPTAFLDPLFKKELIDLFKKINREWGMTIILTSHHLSEIVNLAGKCLVLRQGKIAYLGRTLAEKKLICYY